MKRILTLVALLLTAAITYAQQITEQAAMERALQYMNSQMSAQVFGLRAPARGGSIKLESAPVEAQSIYAFNIEDGGFIIASADSRTLPVLGYSTNGSIDWDNMPENMRAWLKGYDDAVATLGNRNDFIDGNVVNRESARTKRAAVEPLIKTHWNQSTPYWDQCPVYEGKEPGLQGKQCLTGCAATALAQVMNYYQWPETVPDGIPGYMPNIKNDVWYIDSIPPVTFDWDNMLDDYEVLNPDTEKKEVVGTEAQQRAVATLMRYCGQAVEMNYGTREFGSGTYSQLQSVAMKKYFGYSTPIFLDRNEQYSIDGWEDIIYGELAAGRPVLYSGQSNDGGHAFVCDGYDDNGLFHINWGWGGKNDGYFALSVLNPYESTSANLGSELGFFTWQSATIYTDPKMEIQPMPQEFIPEYYQYLNMISEDNIVEYGYIFEGEKGTIADNALGTITQDGQLTPLFFVADYDSILYHIYNYFKVEIDSTIFQPGDSLKLYPMMRLRKPGEEWHIVPPLSSNAVAGRTEDGLFYIKINVSETQVGEVKLTGAITKGTGRVGEPSDLTIYISNQTAKDWNFDLVILPLYYGQYHREDTVRFAIRGKIMRFGTFIKAGQDGETTFSFTPEYSGIVDFFSLTPFDDTYNYKFTLELTDDTLVNYEKYIENRSDYVMEGDKCFYNVELCDTTSTGVPRYVIPSDSIVLNMRYYYNDELVRDTIVKDEIREYLKALSENGGSSFNCHMLIDVSKPGYYRMESYLGDYINGSITATGCKKKTYLKISSIPTSVKAADAETEPDIYYDLLGRRINGVPQKNGVYMKGNRKTIINK